jgi:predicted transcriptional regulator of viral defense system
MARYSLHLLDQHLADGRVSLTAREVQRELGLSPSAASNLLRRWRDTGLVDQVARGHYVIRQLGLLGTRAASEDVALAVAALFGTTTHRIAFRSALDHHGLLVQSTRTVQVACPKHIRVEMLSGRPLQTIQEPESTVCVAAEPAGHGAYVSTVERALLDGAMRPELVGGIDVLATALAAAHVDAETLGAVAQEVGAAAGLRRLGSLADQLEIPLLGGKLKPLRPPTSDLDLEPRRAEMGRGFRDTRWHIRWASPPDELAAVVDQ